MKVLFSFMLSVLFFSCTKEKPQTLENQLQNLSGKWTFEQPLIEYYVWEKQDSSYVGAKYTIVEGKDSLIELHSIQKENNKLSYEISKIDSDFPTSMKFFQADNEQNQLRFLRKDSVFPQEIIIDIKPQEMTLTQKGYFATEEIALPLTYKKQN